MSIKTLQLLRISWRKTSKSVGFSPSNSLSKKLGDLSRPCEYHQDSNIRHHSSSPIVPDLRDGDVDLIMQLPPRFLRLSSSGCYDHNTHQRIDINVDPIDGRLVQQRTNVKYAIQSISRNKENDNYDVGFVDGYKSTVSMEWVQTQLDRLHINEQRNANDGISISQKMARIPWSNMKESELRLDLTNASSTVNEQNRGLAVSFRNIVLGSDHKQHTSHALKTLYQYGILLVTSTPTNDDGAGVAALSSVLSGAAIKTSPETSYLAHYRHCHEHEITPSPILPNATDGPFRTLYGGIWSTHSTEMPEGVSVADSAYGNEALPLHTDMTYYRDPPGLQILTMVSPADVGGESTFTDGLAIAERMRKNHPDEFDVLCRTVRRYRSIDESTGWHLEGSGPVFNAIDRWQNYRRNGVDNIFDRANRWGAVVGIRHNDLDRLPDLPPLHATENDFVDGFYEELESAHSVLDNLLSSDEFRLVVALQPGETVVVSNHRCLHGRQSFLATKSPREVMGCYVSQDDLESRFRWMMKGHGTFQ